MRFGKLASVTWDRSQTGSFANRCAGSARTALQNIVCLKRGSYRRENLDTRLLEDKELLSESSQ